LPRRFIGSLLLVGLAACGGVAEYHKTGGTYAARGPDCQYRVIRNRIVEPYEEVGVVDIDAFSVRQLPTNEQRFRKTVGEHVCKAGGDAIIPAINMGGRWVHGTIIRFRPSECLRCRETGIYRNTAGTGQADGEEG
jgi:hypothetical protein